MRQILMVLGAVTVIVAGASPVKRDPGSTSVVGFPVQPVIESSVIESTGRRIQPVSSSSDHEPVHPGLATTD